MEIPAWLFISFWAVISITFLHLGFYALEITEVSNSVSPLVMFVFKHSVAISSCFSSSYALIFRARQYYVVRSNYVLLVYVVFSVVSSRTIEGIFIWRVMNTIFDWLVYFLSKLKIFLTLIFLFYSKIMLIIGVIIIALIIYHLYSPTAALISTLTIFPTQFLLVKWLNFSLSATQYVWNAIFAYLGVYSTIILGFVFLCCAIQFILACKSSFIFWELRTRALVMLALEISLFFVSTKKRNFSPILVLSVLHLISMFWGALSIIVLKVISILKKKEGSSKFIKFTVGTAGAILFQNFFRITSLSEIVAFLYFAVMWLANLVLLGFPGDLGIFNFLLANVVVSCTVGEFGLYSATWLAFGATLLLYALRLRLESLTLPYAQAQRIKLSFFAYELVPRPHRLAV